MCIVSVAVAMFCLANSETKKQWAVCISTVEFTPVGPDITPPSLA